MRIRPFILYMIEYSYVFLQYYHSLVNGKFRDIGELNHW